MYKRQGLALRADLEDSVWSPGGVSKWLAPPVKVHAALNQKICNIQDDYGYDIGTVALDDADHNPTADTTPVGALLNGTLDFGADGKAGAPADVDILLQFVAPLVEHDIITIDFGSASSSGISTTEVLGVDADKVSARIAGTLASFTILKAVSYTHLTLPTKA